MKALISSLLTLALVVTSHSGCSDLKSPKDGSDVKQIAQVLQLQPNVFVLVNSASAAGIALAAAAAAGAAQVVVGVSVGSVLTGVTIAAGSIVGGTGAAIALYYILNTDVQIPGEGYLGYYKGRNQAFAAISATQVMGDTVGINTSLIPARTEQEQAIRDKLGQYPSISQESTFWSKVKTKFMDGYWYPTCEARQIQLMGQSGYVAASASSIDCLSACTLAMISACAQSNWKDMENWRLFLTCNTNPMESVAVYCGQSFFGG